MSAVGRDARRRGRAGRARRSLRRPARGPGAVRPARAAGRAGAGRGHRRARRVAVLAGRRRRGRSTPSPDRVEPPCPWAGPGRCGGCDWQHASLPAQRALKAAVVREQLQPAGRARPRRRRSRRCRATRTGWAGGPGCSSPSTTTGRPGLRRHRSHEVVPVDHCRIAHPLVDEAGVTGRRWPGVTRRSRSRSSPVDRRAAGAAGRPRARARSTEVGRGERSFRRHRRRLLAGAPGGGRRRCWPRCSTASTRSRGSRRSTSTAASGCSRPRWPTRVGPTGRVTAVETDRVAVEDARHNLAGLAGVRVERGRVDHVLRRLRLGRADLVVLDPPRSGAGRAVVDLLSRVRARADRLRRLRPGGAGPRPALLRRARATGWPGCGRSTCSR